MWILRYIKAFVFTFTFDITDNDYKSPVTLIIALQEAVIGAL